MYHISISLANWTACQHHQPENDLSLSVRHSLKSSRHQPDKYKFSVRCLESLLYYCDRPVTVANPCGSQPRIDTTEVNNSIRNKIRLPDHLLMVPNTYIQRLLLDPAFFDVGSKGLLPQRKSFGDPES